MPPNILMVKPKFPLGQIVVTRGVHELMKENPDFAIFVQECLTRHMHKDWGDVCDDDKKLNDAAMEEGERLLSAYNDDRFPKNGVATLWILTEADRNSTCLLFPDEY